MAETEAELVDFEADQIVAEDRLNGSGRDRIVPDYEALAKAIEGRAALHIRGPVHARRVAEELRRRG